MTSAQYQNAPITPNMQPTMSTSGFLTQQPQTQQNALQPNDPRITKRIKTEHDAEGESDNAATLPASGGTGATYNHAAAASIKGNVPPSQLLNLPGGRSSQQMGPPMNARPSTSANPSYSNGIATPGPTSPPVQSPQQTPRPASGPGRVPYQFGSGLPTPGINFTRTPTTGSFVNQASNSSSRQQTPTRAVSRGSPSTTQQPQASTSSFAGGETRSNGVEHLQDLLSISGVDLRAEEEAAQRSTMGRTSFMTANAAATHASQQPQIRQDAFYLDIYALSRQIHRIAAKNGLRVEPEVLTYLSLAAKSRTKNLLEAMIAASRHRNWSSNLRAPPLYEKGGQAMYHQEILDDPQKLIAALMKVEKRSEQEARQRRLDRDERGENAAREEAAAAAAAAAATDATKGDASGAADASATDVKGKEAAGSTDSKKKKPGNSAKNMSDDKRLKLANKTAAQALGITSGGKAWMFGGGSGSGTNSPFGKKKGANAAGGLRLPKPRFAPTATAGQDAKEEDGEGPDQSTAEAGDTSTTATKSVRGDTAGESRSVGSWGDLAARQRFQEEEEKLAMRSVNLQDALHALEMERKGGAGRGSGETILYTTLALGRPPIRKL